MSGIPTCGAVAWLTPPGATMGGPRSIKVTCKYAPGHDQPVTRPATATEILVNRLPFDAVVTQPGTERWAAVTW